MEMDVINGLPCLPVAVENEPEAPLSHEDVNRGLGIDIFKGKDIPIFVDNL
jgi:hypothetical protein